MLQEKLPEQATFAIPLLADIPFLGPMLFRQHPMVYAAMLLGLGLWWFLYRSRAGPEPMREAMRRAPESRTVWSRPPAITCSLL